MGKMSRVRNNFHRSGSLKGDDLNSKDNYICHVGPVKAVKMK